MEIILNHNEIENAIKYWLKIYENKNAKNIVLIVDNSGNLSAKISLQDK